MWKVKKSPACRPRVSLEKSSVRQSITSAFALNTDHLKDAANHERVVILDNSAGEDVLVIVKLNVQFSHV